MYRRQLFIPLGENDILRRKSAFWILACIVCCSLQLTGQTSGFFVPSDTLDTGRFHKALLFSGVTYTGFSIGLYHAWYRNYPQSSFHLFNDWGEWRHMDKVGHVYTAYIQGVLCYKGARWTGLDEDKSILTGMICGSLFQTTIEIMDGFSKEWGFSVSDMGANILGTATFALQQRYWGEQRISLKVSSSPATYSSDPIYSVDGLHTSSLNERANSLFGRSFAERYLKDYNAQTYWLSVNVKDFMGNSGGWPAWLNMAVGYGGANMFGGYENTWEKESQIFKLSEAGYPRYSQFYIGPDINLTRLGLKSPFLKTLATVFNIFKVPAPALEINTRGQVIFHLIKI